MPLWTKSNLTILEETDCLIIRIDRQRGSLELTIGVVLILFAFFGAYEWKSLFWLFSGLLGTWGLLSRSLRGNTTELTVTEKCLSARGDLGSTFNSVIRLETAELDSLTHQSGDENSESGLYAKHGWKSTCLIPQISEAQSNEITTAIFRRFPCIGKPDTNPGSLLFGKQSGITTLDI